MVVNCRLCRRIRVTSNVIKMVAMSVGLHCRLHPQYQRSRLECHGPLRQNQKPWDLLIVVSKGRCLKDER